jgi:hypothetical protein
MVVLVAYRFVGILLWLAFFIVVPRKQWRWCYPTLIFTALWATFADLMGVVYLQWEYIGPTTGGLSLWADLGFAPPSGALAIYLHHQYPRWAWLNWTFWIVANSVGEWLFVNWGLIRYHGWNTLQASLFYFLFFAVIYLQDQWYRRFECKTEKDR